jgi:hypothetical protein
MFATALIACICEDNEEATKAVVASLVLLSPVVAVTPVAAPEKLGVPEMVATAPRLVMSVLVPAFAAPKLVSAVAATVAPVPPDVIGTTEAESYLEEIAAAILVNSAENSVPLTTLAGFPLRRESLAAKSVEGV